MNSLLDYNIPSEDSGSKHDLVGRKVICIEDGMCECNIKKYFKDQIYILSHFFTDKTVGIKGDDITVSKRLFKLYTPDQIINNYELY